MKFVKIVLNHRLNHFVHQKRGTEVTEKVPFDICYNQLCQDSMYKQVIPPFHVSLNILMRYSWNSAKKIKT